MTATWVVKIGGSLLGSDELPHWLEIFAKFSDGRVVIVPGGGVFADAVREAQRQSGVDDVTAHALAVHAMDQYGRLLAGMNPQLVTASTELEIAERGWQHRAIIWLPSHMALADETIPQNWDVTSDSLAAWLARKLDAQHLILLKSVPTMKPSASIEVLIEQNVVDTHFRAMLSGQSVQAWMLSKQNYTVFMGGLDEATLTSTATKMIYQGD